MEIVKKVDNFGLGYNGKTLYLLKFENSEVVEKILVGKRNWLQLYNTQNETLFKMFFDNIISKHEF